MNLKKEIILAVGGIGAILAKALGGWDIPLQIVVVLCIIDFVIGVTIPILYKKSLKTENGKLSSRVMAKGIYKKGMMFLVIIISVQIDLLIGDGSIVRNATITAYSLNELISIIESLISIDVYIPQVIKNTIEAIKIKESEVEK